MRDTSEPFVPLGYYAFFAVLIAFQITGLAILFFYGLYPEVLPNYSLPVGSIFLFAGVASYLLPIDSVRTRVNFRWSLLTASIGCIFLINYFA